MSTTSAPRDFSDIVTAVRTTVKADSSTPTTTTIKRLINTRLVDMHIQANFPWAERRATLLTHAPYTTGTVDTTVGSVTVTGTSTVWTTSNSYGQANVRTTGVLVFSGDPQPYRISTVDGAGTLTLATRWIGAAALAGATYTYLEPEYDLASDLLRMKHPRQFSDVLQIPILPRDEFDRRFPRNTTQGTPIVCTIVDVGFAASASRVQRVVFAQVPNATLQIPYWYITRNLAVSSAGVEAEALSADTDEPIIDRLYRHVLVEGAAADYFRDGKDDARSAEHEGRYEAIVNRTKQDSPPERDRPRLEVVPRHNVNHLLQVRGRGGRYVTGASSDRWDQFRE